MVLQNSKIYDDRDTKSDVDFKYTSLSLFGFISIAILIILATVLCFDTLEYSHDTVVLFLIVLISLDSWSFVPYILERHIAKKSQNTPYQTDNTDDYKWIKDSVSIGFISMVILTILVTIVCFDVVKETKSVPLKFSKIMISFDIWAFMLYFEICRVKVTENIKVPYKIDFHKSLEDPIFVGFLSIMILTIPTAIAYFNTEEIPYIFPIFLILMIPCNICNYYLFSYYLYYLDEKPQDDEIFRQC